MEYRREQKDDGMDLMDVFMSRKTEAQNAAARELKLMDLSAYGYLATGYIEVSSGEAHITYTFSDEDRFLSNLEAYYKYQYTKEEIKEKVHSGELMGHIDEIEDYLAWYVVNDD